MHGAGLAKVLDLAREAGGNGHGLMDSLAGNSLVANLLLLHGLHPQDLETRVRHALDKVRPYLRSHGGNVDLVDVTEGAVRLRMEGSCHGCPSSAMTLKLAIEEAIYEAAPDVTALEVEGVVEPTQGQSAKLVSLPLVNDPEPALADRGAWEEVPGPLALPEGTVEIRDVAGRAVLFCRLSETWYAYETTCPACGQALEDASLNGTALVCAACGQRYDVARAGRGLDKPDLHLEPFPLLVERGKAKVALALAFRPE